MGQFIGRAMESHVLVVWRTRAGNMIASGVPWSRMSFLVGTQAIILMVCVIIGEAHRTRYVSAETHVQTLCLTHISSRKHDIIQRIISLVYTTTFH